jgi:hypothetical protein
VMDKLGTATSTCGAIGETSRARPWRRWSMGSST